MNAQNILAALNRHYDKNIQAVELFREGGTCSYIATAYGTDNKYFLKTIRYPFLETALESVAIQMYLLLKEFPVIPIIFTKEGAPYDFIEGSEPAPNVSGGQVPLTHMKLSANKFNVQDRIKFQLT